ncbi:MAG: hypothetical protein PHY09_17815 [Desulfuromonadaceae bacterium]|nr:hypothetical protein [Desulfuromonadaceae bacterium]MDD5104125.1 hypothetical protein [Desulfuromonadaceae bacterium]
MATLPYNSQLSDTAGHPLSSLLAINRLDESEKERIYSRLLPQRLRDVLGLTGGSLCNSAGERLVTIIAPQGLPLVRIEARSKPVDSIVVFFLELSDTQFHQMELSFCIIRDPAAPRYAVDVDEKGDNNWFASHGRNIPEELRAMRAGLFPNQTHHGLQLFVTFFPLLERFTDSLGIQMIVAEPLTYDNAIRYEKYGFDYLRGKRLMREIDREFQPGGRYFSRLDGSNPFRMPGMDRTVIGRSWAIHDGIMDEPWDEIQIYRMIGAPAAINTFPGREEAQR